MTRDKGRMSYSNFVLLCDKLTPFLQSPKLNWFDLHGYGEPLLDHELILKIQYVRNHFPHVKTRIVTTLYNIRPDIITSYLSCGLTEMVISHYATSEEDIQKIYGVRGFAKMREGINSFLSLNHDRGNPLQIVIENISMKNLLPEKQEATRMANISSWHRQAIEWGAKIRDLSSPHNWGSAFHFRKISLGTCSVVNGFRRRILQITWDGKIIPCCFDYNAEVVFGNIFINDIGGVFSSTTYKEFISDHMSNRLNPYPPCIRCHRCNIP